VLWNSPRKAQTTIVLILLLIIIFGGVVLFLLSFAQTVSRVEYTNMYVHNLLLSTLRTNTPYFTDTDCTLVSDTVHCAYYKPSWHCGRGEYTCFDVANNSITSYMKQFEDFMKNYRYLFLVEPETTIVREDVILIGDTSLEDEQIEKIVANERIQKGLQILNVQLIVAKR
jgi:hypothetical protein